MLDVHKFKRERRAVEDAADTIEMLAEQLIGKARELRNHADAANWTDAETAIRFANSLETLIKEAIR